MAVVVAVWLWGVGLVAAVLVVALLVLSLWAHRRDADHEPDEHEDPGDRTG